MTYSEFTDCLTFSGNVLYIITAVEILEDLAGSVSINRETRKQISSLRDDKAMLERTITELKASLADQNER